MASEFYALARDASEAGTRVAFEPMPFADVKTPQQALDFTEKAGHPVGGMLLDIWQVARAGLDVRPVAAIPAQWIVDVELDDAPIDFEGHMIADTFNGRRLPGEGELDVEGFVDAVKVDGLRRRLGGRNPVHLSTASSLSRRPWPPPTTPRYIPALARAGAV